MPILAAARAPRPPSSRPPACAARSLTLRSPLPRCAPPPQEIYNEVLNDLLNPARTNLKLREDPRRGFYVEGITEEVRCCARWARWARGEC